MNMCSAASKTRPFATLVLARSKHGFVACYSRLRGTHPKTMLTPAMQRYLEASVRQILGKVPHGWFRTQDAAESAAGPQARNLTCSFNRQGALQKASTRSG
eukprot:6212511-Pleurochrysis_carterae.AAC.2